MLNIHVEFINKEAVAEWLKAVDCKSIEFNSTLVRIQPSSLKLKKFEKLE